MSAEGGSCKDLWICCSRRPYCLPRNPSSWQPCLLCSHLNPASCQHPYAEAENKKGKKERQKRGKKKKRKISNESINFQQHFQSLQRKGAKHTGQTLSSIAGRGNLENCLQPLIDTNPCFSFLPHHDFQSSIFLGLPQLLQLRGSQGLHSSLGQQPCAAFLWKGP